MRGNPDLRGFLTRRPKRPWLVIATITSGAVVFSVLAGLFLAGLHKLAVRAHAEQHPEDVQVAACTSTAFGALTGQVTVINSAAVTATYTISIRFTTIDGRKLASTSTVVGFVHPGTTEEATVRTVAGTIPAEGPVGCMVSSARRRPV